MADSINDELPYIRKALVSAAQCIGDVVPRSAWYLFGSALRDACAAADVDLLICCETDDDAVRIRKALSLEKIQLPVHLLLMTYGEQEETDFIREQGCKKIFPE